jgi:hypothetical protein
LSCIPAWPELISLARQGGEDLRQAARQKPLRKIANRFGTATRAKAQGDLYTERYAGLKTRFPGLKRLRKKSLLRIESCPQRLKPDLFSISYVRAEARTLQQPDFFRSL